MARNGLNNAYYGETFNYDEKEKEFFIMALFDAVLLENDDAFEFQYTDEEKKKLIG